MKPDAYRQLCKYRIREGQLASGDEIRNNGAFMLPPYKAGDQIMLGTEPFNNCTLGVVVSDGEGWDHVSVSLPSRCPSWEEMCFVKDLFFEPHEVVMQLHPERAEYVNYHPHCLHLWRPQNRKIPTPPAVMVGPKSEPVNV
jgi:hypothetical protein